MTRRYIHIITLVTWPDGSDHVEWLRQEYRITRDEVECDSSRVIRSFLAQPRDVIRPIRSSY